MADSPSVSGSSSDRGSGDGDGGAAGESSVHGGDCSDFACKRHVQWRKAPSPLLAPSLHGTGGCGGGKSKDESKVQQARGDNRNQKEGRNGCFTEKTPLLTPPFEGTKSRYNHGKQGAVSTASTKEANALGLPSPPLTPSTASTTGSDTASTTSEPAQDSSIGPLVAFFSLGSASDISWNAIYMSVAYFETLEGKGVISKLGLAQNIPWLLAMILMVAWPQAADSTRAAVFTILFTHIYMFSLCILFPVLVFRGIEVASVVLYALVAVNGVATGLSQSYVAACSALFSRDPKCRAATSYQLIGAAFGISTPTLIQLFLVPRMLKAKSSAQSYDITIFSIKVVFPCAAAMLLLSLIALAYVVRHANFKAAEREGITNCNATCGVARSQDSDQGVSDTDDSNGGGGGGSSSSSSNNRPISSRIVAVVEEGEWQGWEEAYGVGCGTARQQACEAIVVQAEDTQPLLQQKQRRQSAEDEAWATRRQQGLLKRIRRLLPVIAVVLAESFVSAVMSFSCAASPHLSPMKKTPFWNRNLDTLALICFSISGFVGRAIPEQAAKVKWLARMFLATPTMAVLVITQVVFLAGVAAYVHWRKQAFAFLESWDDNNSFILAWYAVGAIFSGTAIVGLSRYIQHRCRQSHVLPCSTVGQLVWLSLQLGSVAGIATSLANGT